MHVCWCISNLFFPLRLHCASYVPASCRCIDRCLYLRPCLLYCSISVSLSSFCFSVSASVSVCMSVSLSVCLSPLNLHDHLAPALQPLCLRIAVLIVTDDIIRVRMATSSATATTVDGILLLHHPPQLQPPHPPHVQLLQSCRWLPELRVAGSAYVEIVSMLSLYIYTSVFSTT